MNGLKFDMLMYPDHLQNIRFWSFSLFWQDSDSVKQVKIVVSGHFLENAWEKWPKIQHTGVS